nr:hypothetical protein [Actinomycetota bacterium]
MRRLWIAIASVLLLSLFAAPANAQVTAVDAAANALRSNPVYVDSGAERAGDVDVDRLRARIRQGDTPIFVAVLPAAAVREAGGDVNRLPTVLAQRVGLRGTYAVVAGSSFRAGSNVLPQGQAGSLATASFQARSGDGVGAVLETFVDRVNSAAPRSGASGSSGNNGGSNDGGSSGGGGSGGLLLLLALGGGGFF